MSAKEISVKNMTNWGYKKFIHYWSYLLTFEWLFKQAKEDKVITHINTNVYYVYINVPKIIVVSGTK